MSTLNRFFEAYVSRDMDGAISFLAPDPDLVGIGTGVDEKRLGLNEVRVQMERDWAAVRGSINRARVELGISGSFDSMRAAEFASRTGWRTGMAPGVSSG